MRPRVPERVLPYLLLLPSLLFLAVFYAWPLVEAIRTAFTAEGALGLGNFRTMAADLNFRAALRNTVLLVVVVVPIQLALALGLGSLLGRTDRGRDLYLYVWTIPLGISDLAAGLVWLAIMGERGYLNTLLTAVGVVHRPTLWLSYETPGVLFAAVVAAEVWRATAIVLVIVVAGMQLVPREYGEAADVFGAGPWQRFRRVSLPLLKPSIQTALILRTILAFEVFAVVLTLGGRDLPVLMGEAYNWQYAYENTGVASALAVVILGLSLLATLVYLRVLRIREETIG